MKRQYELTVILSSSLNAEAQSKQLKAVKSLVEKFDGKMGKTGKGEEKQLAYPIKKQTRGVYVTGEVELPAEKISELEAKLELETGVLRHLLVRSEKKE